jgi:hypothetical protein
VPLSNGASSFSSVNSSWKQGRKQKDSQEESCETPKLADLSWLPFLFSPRFSPHYGRCGAVSPGLRLSARKLLTPALPAGDSCTGDNGLDGAICQSLEVGIRYLTATSV